MLSPKYWYQTLLKLRTWYKVHKWTAIVTGLALVMWLITGMLISWERLFPKPDLVQFGSSDYETASVSPAEAIGSLESVLGRTVQVQSIDLREVLDVIVYDIRLKSGRVHMIDVHTGKEFTITPEIAEQLAKAKMPVQANVLAVDLVDRNSYLYPFGPVPVYQVKFDDNSATQINIPIINANPWGLSAGEVWPTDRWKRIRNVVNSLHTFDTLKIVTDRGRLIKALLWGVTFLTIFAVLIGYYLALPRRWQFSSRRQKKSRRTHRTAVDSPSLSKSGRKAI